MKSGLAAGFIAGIITGLLSTIFLVVGRYMGLYGILQPPKITELLIFSLGWIIITIITTIAFGFIYEKFYDSIPGKGIMRGLYFGLLIWCIKDVIAGTYCIYSGIMISGLIEWVAAGINLIVIGIYMWTIYGLILGYLYKPPK